MMLSTAMRNLASCFELVAHQQRTALASRPLKMMAARTTVRAFRAAFAHSGRCR